MKRSPLVIDLSGTALASPAQGSVPGLDWHAYDGESWAEQIWQLLLPVLQPWWELLDRETAIPNLQLVRRFQGSTRSCAVCFWLIKAPGTARLRRSRSW
jgi:hypothetical protein